MWKTILSVTLNLSLFDFITFLLLLYTASVTIIIGDTMMKKDKKEAIKLINKKIANDTYLSYEEISVITGYHPKYLFKLKNEILNGTISLDHGNKNKSPHNALSEDEIKKIRQLYTRSSASIRKFYKFYGKHSYSCIYNIVHDIDKKKI